MRLRSPSIVWAYAALAIAFVGLSAFRMPYREGLRHPTLVFVRDQAQDLGGLVPQGLWQLDQARLRRSVGRMPSVRLARELGNSIRIAGGQVVEWAIWGGKEPLMLFPDIDLWVTRGLTPEVEADLGRAAAIIGEHKRRLEAEGWKLVVLPVPVKLGIHRELCQWPVREPSLLSREVIETDKSDDVYRYFRDGLASNGVASVDLNTLYRESVARRPDVLLFVPGDSHWTGEGIRLAADATAGEISRNSSLRARVPVNPTYYEFVHVGDMAKVFDPYPRFLSRLRPAWTFRERLVNGEEGRGYVYPKNPSGLVAAVGTSYTGQYTWIPQPVGFAWQLGLHLDNAEVRNLPAAGQGSFHAFELFWKKRREIEGEFSSRHGPGLPRVVVWEFPLRDVPGIVGAPALD